MSTKSKQPDSRVTAPRPKPLPPMPAPPPVSFGLHGEPAEQLLPAVDRAAAELAKLNAAMDRLMVSTGDGVIPAVHHLAEQLVAFLDTADGWDEREEENEHGDGGADDEPSLGAGEAVNQVRAWSTAQNPTRDDHEEQCDDDDGLDKLECSDLDVTGEAAGDNGGIVDDEPSLGSLDGRFSQKRWGEVDRADVWSNDDLEHDEAELEAEVE